MVRKKIPPLVSVILLVIIGVLYMVTFVVKEREGALVVTFGKVGDVLIAPQDAGLHFKLPWPAQKVFSYDLREQVFSGPLETVSDAEGTLVVVRAFTIWRINDPRRFHETVQGEVSFAETVFSASLSSGLNEVFSRHRYADLVDPAGKAERGRGAATFVSVEKELTEFMNGTLSQYGIAVHFAGLQKFELPESATPGVFEQMRKSKERDARYIEAQGEAMAQNISAKANRDYERKLAEARTKADEIIAKARAEAAEILSDVKNRELLVFFEKLDTFKQFLSEEATWVVDTRTAPLDLLEEFHHSGRKTAGEAALGGSAGVQAVDGETADEEQKGGQE